MTNNTKDIKTGQLVEKTFESGIAARIAEQQQAAAAAAAAARDTAKK